MLTDKKPHILQELRIPNKLVRLIKMTLQNMEASFKIENLTSQPFSISSGVHQGDPLLKDFKKLKIKNWKETAKDRTWRDLAVRAKTHKVL